MLLASKDSISKDRIQVSSLVCEQSLNQTDLISRVCHHFLRAFRYLPNLSHVTFNKACLSRQCVFIINSCIININEQMLSTPKERNSP